MMWWFLLFIACAVLLFFILCKLFLFIYDFDVDYGKQSRVIELENHIKEYDELLSGFDSRFRKLDESKRKWTYHRKLIDENRENYLDDAVVVVDNRLKDIVLIESNLKSTKKKILDLRRNTLSYLKNLYDLHEIKNWKRRY